MHRRDLAPISAPPGPFGRNSASTILREATLDRRRPDPDQRSREHAELRGRRFAPAGSHGPFGLFDREIFVRELVSNAADACEKLRYESIARPELIEDGAPFAIEIAINPDAKTLTFSDNGIGMTREDLTQGLGTIARSGTKAFLDKLATEDASKEASALIGQFGIGFYPSFMVADEVTVDTRRAGTTEAWRWSSDGKGSFTIAPLPLENAPKRGARVTLHLIDASQEFLQPRTLERIIRDHSGAVAVPIDLIENSAPKSAASATARRSGRTPNPR